MTMSQQALAHERATVDRLFMRIQVVQTKVRAQSEQIRALRLLIDAQQEMSDAQEVELRSLGLELKAMHVEIRRMQGAAPDAVDFQEPPDVEERTERITANMRPIVDE